MISFFKFSQHKGRRDHPLQLFNTDYRLNVRPSFFSVRVSPLWNRLPVDFVQDNNLIKFKSMFRNGDFSFALLGKI